MLFMVVERFAPGKAVEVYRRYRSKGRMAPAGVRYIDSWVDLDFRRCYQVMEAASETILKQWTDQWDDLVEFEIVAVRSSEEAAKVIGPEL